ncbi:IS5 family transposase [Kitasatospora sp. A2-31]|uniref:IS5 family transposase n=2 Tax=Kitasatospora sp. A2-31 TaxID=2916414 RepID=UPI001EE9EBC9|nr:IS5 family transposase [Kitasatospora sp. A2-31]MCG6497686.1 IS5 family transposase [Kitasatospora sp. A2-31]MCG6498226.1 IS5 family transposase [Kitasatospora sp. A2-31]
MSHCGVPAPSASTFGVSPCDCLAHQFGNAADHPDRTRRYPSDLTDAEWALVRPLLPVPAWMNGRGGRPEGYCHRQMIDAVRYLVAEGVRWASLPADFPRWRAAYRFFRRWRDNDLIKELYGRLRARLRELAGRKDEPTAAIIDSQSVKGDATVPTASRGYDAGKRINGRKRHIAVDTLGLLLVVIVTAASVSDRDAGRDLLERVRARHRAITLVWADGGYTGWLVDFARAVLSLALTIVKRPDDASGFTVLPRRWVVERSFSHLIRARRLARDYETRTDSAEAMLWWAASIPATRRLARRGAPAARRLSRPAPAAA